MNKESNIVHESANNSHYVYKISIGHYEVRKNGLTHAIVIGNFDNPDEDSDQLERAIEMCDYEANK